MLNSGAAQLSSAQTVHQMRRSNNSHLLQIFAVVCWIHPLRNLVVMLCLVYQRELIIWPNVLRSSPCRDPAAQPAVQCSDLQHSPRVRAEPASCLLSFWHSRWKCLAAQAAVQCSDLQRRTGWAGLSPHCSSNFLADRLATGVRTDCDAQ